MTLRLLLLSVLFAACAPETAQEVAPKPSSEAQVRGIHAFLESAVSEGRVAGAVALVARGSELLSLEAVGMADREAGRPMEENTLFRIASMSKPITSVAVMMLFEEGGFALDDPASKFIPELSSPKVLRNDGSRETLPAAGEITIRQLLTHTSGIAYRFLGNEPLATMYAEAGVSDGLIETEGTIGEGVKRIAGLPLLHQPGERWSYGLSTDVLGYLVEVVSGQSLDLFLRERIFEPLGMADTRFFLSEEEPERLAAVYSWSKSEGLRRLGDEPVIEAHLSYSTTFHYRGPRTYFSGGAGLVSTARDYFRFALMLRNGGELDGARLLKPET
ncbi:MAG: serine hydrolase domain-containing protein, partial [Vicinamibacteria bacterium]